MKKSILDKLLDEDVFLKENKEEDKILSPLLQEINLISSVHIKNFVRSVLLKCEAFWIIPSSFSKKYHPIDEHNQGGNVIHTQRAVRAAKILCASYGLEVEESDLVYAALLLHDITKGVKRDGDTSYVYDSFHPYTVEKFVAWCIEEDKKYSSEASSATLYIDDKTVQDIMRLIRCHLGPWSPVPETIPGTHLEMIVHLADNISSKLHTIVDGEAIIEHRWKPDDKQTS